MRRWIRVGTQMAIVACLFFAAAVPPAFSGNSGQQKSQTTRKKEKSLFQRLGGRPAIVAVVDEFVARVAADERINKFFAATDISRLKMHLVNQICEASGGPCKYTGRTMKDTHQGMGISASDFNALVEDLVGALDKFKVGAKEKSELLGILAPMKPDIVEEP